MISSWSGGTMWGHGKILRLDGSRNHFLIFPPHDLDLPVNGSNDELGIHIPSTSLLTERRFSIKAALVVAVPSNGRLVSADIYCQNLWDCYIMDSSPDTLNHCNKRHANVLLAMSVGYLRKNEYRLCCIFIRSPPFWKEIWCIRILLNLHRSVVFMPFE